MVLIVREAVPEDVGFLVDMVAVAFDWRTDAHVRSALDVLASPETARYVSGWPQAGDGGVVAELVGLGPVGACWWRYLPVDDPGYGFVRVEIPEVTVGVIAKQRGAGVGDALLRRLISLADQARLPGLSLSVEPENYAIRLYERLGFMPVGTNGGSVTMLLTLG